MNLAKHLIYFGYYTLNDLLKLTKVLLDMLEKRFDKKCQSEKKSESKFEKKASTAAELKSIVSETKMKIIEILQVRSQTF